MIQTTMTTLPIGQIALAHYNPRRMPASEMRALQASLRTYGFVQPVVVRDGDFVCIGGHQRLAAYSEIVRESGRDPFTEHVPVALVGGLDESKTRALNVALNRISGEWDYDALADMLQSVNELDVGLTGLTDIELRDLEGLANGINDLTSSGNDTVDIDKILSLDKRKLALQFVFSTDADLSFVLKTLAEHGLKSKSQAGAALLAVCKAARAKSPAQATQIVTTADVLQ